ncbi:MAG: hypothetical protein QOF40_3638 [Actinomycetota bacterium]|nr:hypothetical protein [Actinomycetota bacterium]
MRRQLALAGVVVALAVSAAACGSGGGGGDVAVSIKTLKAAATNTQSAKSTSFSVTMKLSAPGRQVEIGGAGVTTADGKHGKITLGVSSVGSLEERITPDGIYMDFGGISKLASELPAGKRWVFLSYDAISRQTGTDLRSLVDQSQSSNPKQGLEYLQATSGDVTKVGDDEVGNLHATHYRTTIDYTKFANEKLAGAKPEVRDRIAALGKVPADVWINDSDRVVKTHYAIDASAFGARSGTADMTMVITGFDDPVDVQAPPVDQTIDAASLGAQPA